MLMSAAERSEASSERGEWDEESGAASHKSSSLREKSVKLGWATHRRRGLRLSSEPLNVARMPSAAISAILSLTHC
jgi:hypothetical protein